MNKSEEMRGQNPAMMPQFYARSAAFLWNLSNEFVLYRDDSDREFRES